MTLDVRLKPQIDAHPYPLLFATISGAHLYGFPSPDSDVDLRGVHVLSLHDVLGLESAEETVERSGVHNGLEIDLVTHDVKKFVQLMLRRNGYVLEQLLSPLIEWTTPEHEELRSLATGCVTKHHAHHYLGFAATQWKLFGKESPPRVKPLLYVFRVLLTGIHLMRSGKIEANVVHLNAEFNLPYIVDLVDRKTAGPEKGTLDAADLEYFEKEYLRLTAELESAYQSSQLPELPSARPALSDLLRRIRYAAR
ncbi:MAG: nucleotidyltransferase domain-containing protein [Pirellulaceae bacterium]|nr:nucleotidyltransferase domain-containing protein [Pirellulaceae bacterium]